MLFRSPLDYERDEKSNELLLVKREKVENQVLGQILFALPERNLLNVSGLSSSVRVRQKLISIHS